MDEASQILVIIIAVALAVFLALAIVLIIQLIKLSNQINKTARTFSNAAVSVESIVANLAKATSQLVVAETVKKFINKIFDKKKGKKDE
jgi:uncharacterized protein YoxC